MCLAVLDAGRVALGGDHMNHLQNGSSLKEMMKSLPSGNIIF